MGALSANAVIVLIMVVALGGAIVHLYKAKKRGARCIGCATGECCCCSGESKETTCKQV